MDRRQALLLLGAAPLALKVGGLAPSDLIEGRLGEWRGFTFTDSGPVPRGGPLAELLEFSTRQIQTLMGLPPEMLAGNAERLALIQESRLVASLQSGLLDGHPARC